jgi:toxin secretion/phage lysis holin
METVWAYIQGAIAVVGAALGWFLGGVDAVLYALLAVMAVDYITGVLSAIVRGELSPAVGAQGILSKVMIVALVGVAHLVDVTVLGDGSALRTAVTCFYLSNEGISILANATELGLPVPQAMQDALATLGKTSLKPDEKVETDEEDGNG